jgi:hypothetical protein
MLVKVEFASFALDPHKNMPLIFLKESSGARMFSVTIGPLEAGAIAMETLKVGVEKPLTIDLAKSILERSGGTLKRVILHLDDGQDLMARLEIAVLGGIQGIACRPCDAIALAMRCNASLYAREEVFEKFSDNKGESEQQKLRQHIASLDTLDFGTIHLE